MNLLTKQKQTHSAWAKKTNLRLPKGKGGQVRDKLGIWDQQIQTTVFKINIKVLLQSTGNYIQYPVINRNRKEYEREYIHMYN